MTEILCVVCQKRRPQWPLVCEADRRRMRDHLAELVEQYALLDAVPGASNGPKVSGTRTAPLPARLDVLNLVGVGRDGITDPSGDQVGELPPLVWLDQWVRDWRDVRGQDEHLPNANITDLVKFLERRLDWAGDEHPAVDEFARELADQVVALRRVNGERSDWRRIGECPEDEDGKPCGTPLYANPWIDVVTCKGCETRWDREHWLWLGSVLRSDGVA